MDLRNGTAHSTSVSSQIHYLHKTPKASRKFEQALDTFLANTERDSVVDNIRDVELEEFIDFLDEVRSPHKSLEFCL